MPSSQPPVSKLLVDKARLALSCLDLTRLGDQDTEADIAKLCLRAQSPYGPVAAVCVWPHLASFARKQLPAHIAVAAVANFPDGSVNVQRAVSDTLLIVDSGAQEIDVVLPYKALMVGDDKSAAQVLVAVRAACPGLVLKVILETGELRDPGLIATASHMALDAGADFLKTSTGKTPDGATPRAARVMLGSITLDHNARHAGFKASGGVRTLADAVFFLDLASAYFEAGTVTSKRFRLGASSLLDDIESVLGQSQQAPLEIA